MTSTPFPEHEITAIRQEDAGGHLHIVKVKLGDGVEVDAEQVIVDIDAHRAHYTMVKDDERLLVGVRQCADCDARVLWA